jgi:MYXO-CTERM domain-containing protein
MGTNPDFDRMLERVDPSRRDAVRKILLGAALYTAPLIASYSMDSLEGVASAQASNQTLGPQPIPASSGWSLVALTGALSAAAAFVLRRRRDK